MEQIGNVDNLPKELNNPFNSDCITDISIRTFKRGWDPSWCTYGTVKFKNNATGEIVLGGTKFLMTREEVRTTTRWNIHTMTTAGIRA